MTCILANGICETPGRLKSPHPVVTPTLARPVRRGRKKIGETPQGAAQGGSTLAHGKRVYSICEDRR